MTTQAISIRHRCRFYQKNTDGNLTIVDDQNFWGNWLAQLREGEWDISIDDLDREPLQERSWDELFI